MARPKGGASRRRNAATCPLPPRSGKPERVVRSAATLADAFRGSGPSRRRLLAAPSRYGRPAPHSQTLGRGSCQAGFYPQILPSNLLHLHHLGKGLGCLADVGFAIGSAVVLVGCVCALQSSAGASWLPETILGQCLRPEKRVVVLLNREMKEPQAVEVLCHEWAHALAWNFSVGRLINAPDTDPVAFERGCHDEA